MGANGEADLCRVRARLTVCDGGDSRMTVAINRKSYEGSSPGRDDYWRKVAVPRLRVRVLLCAPMRFDFVNVVDVGCGSGVLLREIRARHPGTRPCRIDLSREQIQNRRVSR